MSPPSKAFGNALRLAVRPLFSSLLRRTLPRVEGEISLGGLEGSVEILRDRFGVPQVFAENERDLFFAQGYVHAQDRFFQMELGRRAGHGRLLKLLGRSALQLDRLARALGSGRAAGALDGPPEVFRVLEEYSAGVNACLQNGPRPPNSLCSDTSRSHGHPPTPPPGR